MLAIASIGLWIKFILSTFVVNYTFPPPADFTLVDTFYITQQNLMNYINVVAVNTIFLCVKVFDYMNKSKHMNMLSNTLYTAKDDIFYFLIIFAIFLFGFVGMAYLSFGAYISDFSTFGNSIRKCFEITIGDFDYESMSGANAPMAVLFFFPFNILFVFILTNIFLAILNDAYEENMLTQEDTDNLNILQSLFYCAIPNSRHTK